MIKKILKKVLRRLDPVNSCYSQEGEDMLLSRIMGHIHYAGSFIDIGAHHPIRFSNTYKFYQAGWRGVNIEATPGSAAVFNKFRPLDVNLEIAVSDKEEELTFYMFNYPQLNSFSESQVAEWDGKNDVKLIEKKTLQTSTITKILQTHAPGKKSFDLLSIDVEGLDLKILNTLDFSEYRFKYIIAEDSPGDIKAALDGDMTRFLSSRGYRLLSKLYYSNLYVADEK